MASRARGRAARWGAPALVVWAAAAATLAAAAEPGAVVVVRSADLAPHAAVEKAFVAAYGKGARAIELAPGDLAVQLRAVAGDARVIVAIGPDAARAAVALHRGAVVDALVPPAVQAELGDGARAVPAHPSPGQHVQIVRALLPHARRVGIVYDPAASAGVLAECEAALTAAGLTLVRREVADTAAVPGAVREVLGGVDALWLLADTTVLAPQNVRGILEVAAARHVPLIAPNAALTRAGALFGIEADYADVGRAAAGIARRLADGKPPLPPAPLKGDLFLNAAAARAFDVKVPDRVAARAVKIFDS